MAASQKALPASRAAMVLLLLVGLALKVDHLLPFSVEVRVYMACVLRWCCPCVAQSAPLLAVTDWSSTQTICVWAARMLAGFVLLVLTLFLLVQILWTYRTEGLRSVLVLLFTSFVIFPGLILAELLENIFFPARRLQGKGGWGAAPVKIPPDTMCAVDGIVNHVRTEQAHNAFAYRIRYFLVPLDAPPPSFAGDHMTADEARAFASTDGPVLLLTDPAAAGYHQNPISVYYCYDAAGALATCIAEVTNTPWGERVTFLFDPNKDVVPKSLHVRVIPHSTHTHTNARTRTLARTHTHTRARARAHTHTHTHTHTHEHGR